MTNPVETLYDITNPDDVATLRSEYFADTGVMDEFVAGTLRPGTIEGISRFIRSSLNGAYETGHWNVSVRDIRTGRYI